MPTIPKKQKAIWERTKRTGFQEENRTTDGRYHTTRWRKVRKQVLEENPLCVHCDAQGIVTKATDVDHLIPARQLNDDAFYDIANLQGLCNHHHKVKSAKERGR